MPFTSGLTVPGIDVPRDQSVKVKITKQRTGLTFQPEGFWATIWKTDPIRGTDYDPMECLTKLDGAHDSGVTVITVDDVSCFSESMALSIGSETGLQIRSIDPENDQITLVSATASSHSNDEDVKADRVSVQYSSGDKKTTIKFFMIGQNTDDDLAGPDIQAGCVYCADGFGAKDKCKGSVYLPYWIGSSFIDIFATFMCRGKSLGAGRTNMDIDSGQSASAVDPDYFLQIEFTHEGDTPDAKIVDIDFDMWRVP